MADQPDQTDQADEGAPPALVLNGERATITLQRPRHGNRLQRQDLQVLHAHLRTVADAPACRVLVLAAEGRHFCTGFHLGELEQGEAAASDPLAFEQLVDALEDLALPTLARLQGGVFGGATDLALACDFRVGVQGMVLRMPAARLGLHYYASGLQRYVSRLGLNAAKRLFLLAETVDAPSLLQLGYLTEMTAPDLLDSAVDNLAHALAAGAPLAVQGMKQSLNELARAALESSGTQQLAQRIQTRQARCAGSADLREGLAAWAESRPPRFLGN